MCLQKRPPFIFWITPWKSTDCTNFWYPYSSNFTPCIASPWCEISTERPQPCEHRRTSRGAGWGLQSPPNIWAVRFFWAMTKIWEEGPGRGFWKKYYLSSHLSPAKNKWLKFEEFMVSWGGLVCCQNLPQWCTYLQWYLLHLVQRNDRLVHFVYWKLTCEAPWDSSVSVT